MYIYRIFSLFIFYIIIINPTGVPIHDKSYMFGDNKSVVDSASTPNARLHKWHNMLPFHCVHEAIAFGICNFFHIDGDIDAADIVNKHWSYTKVKAILKPLLFHSGDTMDLYSK